MARIEYIAINPKAIEFINSDEFRTVLAANPNLQLVTIEYNDHGKEVFNEVPLPLPEDYNNCVALTDHDNPDALMWVLNDSYCLVKDPSPAFIEILKVMDAFHVKTIKERLFSLEGQSTWLYLGSAEVLAAEFNFATAEYIL